MTPEPLTDDELVSALKNEADASESYYNDDLSARQDLCLRYYDAEPFGDEVEGLSQIVLPDVAETIDYMTISVLRAFVSGDRVVEFQARREDEEAASEEATEAVHQIFMQHQDGYRVLHDWLKSGLIEIIGVVKSAAVEEDAVDEQRFIATPEEMAAADEQGLFADAEPEIAPNEDGTFSVTIKRAVQRRYFQDYTLPSDEFRFAAGSRHEDEADYLAHVSYKTRSELVEMGFDRDEVYDLPTGEDDALLTRRRGDDDLWSDARHQSMQKLVLWEEYIRIDADGDGAAEMLKCFRVGDRLLEKEIVPDHPFTVFCPFPRPHRLAGNSLAEKAMEIQRVRSVVARQLMNGMYLGNQPRYWVPDESTNDNTISDLLTVIPGAPVRGKGVTPPQPLNSGFDVGKSLPVLEFWSGEKESRTGITRMNQGMDADALNKTATGTALMQAQGQQYEEFIARNFAECLSRMFWRKYRLIKDAGEPFTVKIGGAYADVDPTAWPDEPDMVIRTGLGTNRKEYRIAQRMQLIELQREGLELGLATPQNLFNSGAGLVRDMGIGQPDDFFVDPSQQEGQESQEQQPDPEMVKVQGEQQLQQAKLEGEQQLAAARIELKREEAAAAQQLARERAEFEAALAQERAQFEQQMALDRAEFEQSMALTKAASAEAQSLPRYRPGGDLDK